ncbi:CopD family protein [Acidovorax sp. CCYZU-2555]|uniref:CopD family protein n=1 Tax=Acidovorax sp. CCYZU-2555 TaxID=2835042 RepID=UPI001BCC8617|nr:CopD family protein [Acidovorax sp. CCYZU-2555]MBS7776835.1 CopD family protein [Acidovorax sp. CCYZU-2555]
MIYLWLKAFHVGLAITWSGGLIALCAAVSAWLPVRGVMAPQERRLAQALLQWDGRITVPCMVATWVLGLCLASSGDWLGAGWLNTKLIVVFCLSALHGVLAGTIRRRMRDGETIKSGWKAHSPLICISAFLLIAVLVVIKPQFI